MTKRTLVAILMAVAFFITGSVFFLGGQNLNPLVNKPTVAATIFPLYDITRELVGDEFEVVLLMPPGVSEHTFEPDPQTMRAVSRAELVLAIGQGMDNWVLGLAQDAGVERVMTVERGIELLDYIADEHDEDEGEGMDPHYWLSLLNAVEIARNISDELSRLKPESAAVFEANYLSYREKLLALHQEGLRLRQESGVRSLATFHQAWEYFAQEFEMEVVATFEPFPGQEPSPQYVREFQNSVRRYNLSRIYAEPQLSDAGIRAIAKDLGVEIVSLDPVGGNSGRDTYLKLMEYNIKQVFEFNK
jgi:zinc transport system substrate-binding protein